MWGEARASRGGTADTMRYSWRRITEIVAGHRDARHIPVSMAREPQLGFGRFYDMPFIGMAVTSPSTKRWLEVNQTLCDIFGYPREELVEKSWAEITHPDDVDADVAEFDRVMRRESEGYKMDKRFIRKDGAVIYASIDVQCERNPDGSVERFFATVADITQRKRIEEALRASSDLLQNLARQVPGVIYQFRLYPDGRSSFPFASEAIWDIYEVTPEEVREDATVVFSRIHPDDLDAAAASIEHSARTLEPWQHEYRVVLPRQGVRWRSGLARPQKLEDGSILWHGFITDATERRAAQAALEESEQNLRVQIEHAPEAIVVFDIGAGRFVDANQNALRLFKLDREALLRSGIAEVSPPFQADGQSSIDAGMPLLERAMAGETPVFEWTHRTSDGHDVPCEVRLVRLPSASRRLVRGSVTDITDRNRAQEDLRIKDQLIASSLHGVAIADASGILSYVNDALLRLWGYASDAEVVGRRATEFFDADALGDVGRALFDEGAWQGELSASMKDGTPFDIELSANAMRDASGRVVKLMGSVVDLTDSKRLQAQFLQAQKMESVGRLAGGVAHDFNNLLTVMKGHLELALMQLPAADPIAADLGAVDRAVDSASALTQQLLAFSRKQIIDPRVLDLNESVTRMHGMLKRVLGEDIELRLIAEPDLGLVKFDPNQSEQILANLAVNARDAMPRGGQLTIETANIVLDARYAAEHPGVAPGEYVMLAVTDTGTGMSTDVKSHLFDPFFTTKEPGRGTGLGLAIVYGAVTQNSGHIEVVSEPEHGTTFRIFLPRAQAGLSAEPARAADASAVPRGTEIIVVVEDEEAIRMLSVRTLEGLGYRVLAYPTGTLALRAIADMTGPVDLVVTDVVMPEMNGRELADHLRALRPGLRILFVSGYAENVIANRNVAEGDVDFLAKPYSPAILARRVREALDASA